MKQLIFIVFCGIIFTQKTPELATIANNRTTISVGNWTNPNVWDCNCVPASSDNAIIVHSITVNSEVGIHNYYLGSGGSINFQTGGKINTGL